MELIIKPTGRCNFNCKFCSAYNMDIQHPVDNKVPNKIKKLIEDMKPSTVIVTGGEPLMISPEYYYNLHDICGCRISITSNLKDFYLNPDKWTELFREPWFGVATSFNYGDTRLWDSRTVYDEKMFIEVVTLFEEKVGKKPDLFIAVINESNENTVMDHVYLAKKLGMMVKLNNAIGVGKEGKTYPRYKMFKFYIGIIDAGLEEFEANCASRKFGRCPRNIEYRCGSSIRCCYVDGDGNLRVGICDEQVSMGLYLPEDKYIMRNESLSPEYSDLIKEECAYCELSRLCNGCSINRMEAKKDYNYCEEMKKLESDIIRTGWYI